MPSCMSRGGHTCIFALAGLQICIDRVIASLVAVALAWVRQLYLPGC